ncbi:hypothetical protein D7Z26_23155 [Cohnella endophytica]|uniref:TFIIB-type zinc ribbon-containing protein n=1 Tax=Cohnella endophytica TaxID=2419778 RepID=A0A494XC52_9BACL|nr:hypothetical protein [Cohnella endophytica]RKP47211.1 hypothetical protein D7Z26_23155 [Cohnella endophytica]
MSTETTAAAIRFPCASCGGPMVFDTESQNLKCQYCAAEKTIDSVVGEAKEHSFDDEDEDLESLHDWGTEQQAVHCEACGGETLIPPDQTTSLCVFCGSPKVLLEENVRSIRPESIIPFQVSRDQALSSFASWKKKRWFLPNAFKKQDVRSELNSIYIPYWTYDTETYSVYTAEVGVYHYRTVTRTRVVNGKTETYTTTERYTVWHYTNGDYDRSFDDILIPASGHYDEKLLEKLGDFNLDELHAYRPEYLSGYISERYSVTREEGWEEAQDVANGQLRDEIKDIIGGDEIRNLNIRTTFDDITYKHLLLPVWNASYTYKSKPFYYMVNGQTGTVSGHVPRSAIKITFFTLLCLGVAAAVVLFVMSQQTSTT